MLRVHHSNRMETLVEVLDHLVRQASAPPLAAETIVVPHRSMAHWLSLQLANRWGIAANLRFPFLGNLIWELVAAHEQRDAHSEPFRRDSLRWRILNLLPRLLESGALERTPGDSEVVQALRQQINNHGAHSVQAYQLADALADLFDQYLVYRPDWVLEWEAAAPSADECHWQQALWHALRMDVGSSVPHRAVALRNYIEDLLKGQVSQIHLPHRMLVFAPTTVPPAYLQLLQALATQIPVDLLVLNPCLHYWGDLVSPRRLARLQALWTRHGRPDLSDYYAIPNRLLAAWGDAGRQFHEQLAASDGEHHDCFTASGSPGLSLLEQLQTDILLLHDRAPDGDVEPLALAADDRSIQVHLCHSPLREVQVLHDHLVNLLADPGIEPRDIVVMMPNVAAYAPYIEAVFGQSTPATEVPWSLSDMSDLRCDPLVRLFLNFLNLPDSRLPLSEVLGLLEHPEVQARFDLNAESVLRLREWFEESGIRWGADAAHRGEEGLPEVGHHTWRFGLDRLLLGYALERDDLCHSGVAPYPHIEGSNAPLLGLFGVFWQQLLQLRRQLSTPHPPARWSAVLHGIIEQFFRPSEPESTRSLQRLHTAIESLTDSWSQAAVEQPLPPQWVRTALQQLLENQVQASGYLTGQVTFCAMVPMRSVPFQIVCLLGLGDQAFPRSEPALSFNRMALQPRAGDRALREDDRYLFLEALLSARQQFYLSYVGRSLRDGKPLLPSVLIDELLTQIERGFYCADSEESPTTRIQRLHPMQPFSAQYSPGPGSKSSHNDLWLEPSNSTQMPSWPADFFAVKLPPLTSTEVALSSLLSFWQNPTRALLNERLDLRLTEPDSAVDDLEPFTLNGLDRYLLRTELLDLTPKAVARSLEQLEAAGTLPTGPAGALILQEEDRKLDRLRARLKAAPPSTGLDLEIEIHLSKGSLRGWMPRPQKGWLTLWRPGKLRAVDSLRLWLHHLTLCAQIEDFEGSRFIGLEDVQTFASIAKEQARCYLDDLLERYFSGMCEPLDFFPDTSHTYAKAVREKPDEPNHQAAIEKAYRTWNGSKYSPGERAKPEFALLSRARDPLGSATFAELALRVWGPLLDGLDPTGPSP